MTPSAVVSRVTIVQRLTIEYAAAREPTGQGHAQGDRLDPIDDQRAGRQRVRCGLRRRVRHPTPAAAGGRISSGAAGGSSLWVGVGGRMGSAVCSGKWQATDWPDPVASTSWGTSVTHRLGLSSCSRSQQRVWKRQPDGGSAGLGTSPLRMIRCREPFAAGSGTGAADSSARVYGCAGRA